VILFQNVIKILHRAMSTLLFQNSAGFELNDGCRISSVLVGVGRASNAEKQPTGHGPEGCVENGSAASLLL